MTAPKRIQLRRVKGWRKPEGAVVVARPSKWGNPYRVGTTINCVSEGRSWTREMTSADAVSYFETDLGAGLLPYGRDDVRRELRGGDLACWCPLDQPCHADVLLQIANQGGLR